MNFIVRHGISIDMASYTLIMPCWGLCGQVAKIADSLPLALTVVGSNPFRDIILFVQEFSSQFKKRLVVLL
jgi:glyoxylate carboligase